MIGGYEQWGAEAAKADFDQDGDVDLFIGQCGGGSKLWLNNGRGKSSDSIDLGSGTHAVAIGDVDRDRDLDIFTVGCASPAVWINHTKEADKTIEHYVPELRGTAHEGATVRQVLDMLSSVEYSYVQNGKQKPTFDRHKDSVHARPEVGSVYDHYQSCFAALRIPTAPPTPLLTDHPSCKPVSRGRVEHGGL